MFLISMLSVLLKFSNNNIKSIGVELYFATIHLNSKTHNCKTTTFLIHSESYIDINWSSIIILTLIK